MATESHTPSRAARNHVRPTFAEKPLAFLSRWRWRPFVVTVLALVILAVPVVGATATARAADSAQSCPDVPPQPGPQADSSAWSEHVEALRTRRMCMRPEKPEGARYVEETHALAQAGRADEISNLMRDMMRASTLVDSLHIGQAMEIAAVATSRDNMKATGSHFFRVGERYLSTRTPAQKKAFYYMWAESRLRVSDYVEAMDRLDAALSLPDNAPSSFAVRSMAHSLRVWAQFVAGTLNQSVSADVEENLRMARQLAAQASSPVWTGPNGHPHDARSRSDLALGVRLIQADRWNEALPHLQSARSRATQTGDAWALQASMYVQALVQQHENRSEAAYETLSALRELPPHQQDAAVQALATLEQLQIAAERDEPDRAGEALRTLSALPNVSPTLFARASAIHSDAFDVSGWTSTKTWSRVLLLTFFLTAIMQFGYWALRKSGDEGEAENNATGSSETDDPSPSEGHAYRVPRGLDDPVTNRHATVAFDVQIDLEADEIEEIIRATPFSSGYQDETPDATENGDMSSGSDADKPGADAPESDAQPEAPDGEAPDGEAPRASDDVSDVYVDDADLDADRSGPNVPGKPVSADGAARGSSGGGASGKARDGVGDELSGQIQVPCYGPDGTERDAIDIPARLAGGLLKRKIIALEADGDVLLLYRFETGTNSVVQYDPESGQFSEVQDETFHAFPIARVDPAG